MKIRVYTKPDCMPCKQTMRLFDRAGVPYEVEDLMDDQNLAAAKELGFMQAPVVAVGLSADDMWSGLQPDRVQEVITKYLEGAK